MLEFDDVAGGLDEGKGNVVVIFSTPHFDVVKILVGQNIAAEISIGKVKAFTRHDEAIVFGFDFDCGTTYDFGDGGFNFTVEHREGFAEFDFAGEIVLDGHGHTAVVFEVVVSFENELVAFFKVEMVVF